MNAFLEQATQVREWEALILANATRVNDLRNTCDAVAAKQSLVSHGVDAIQEQQTRLLSLLDRLELETDKITVKSTQDHMTREGASRLAEEIDSQLNEIAELLNDTIHATAQQNEKQLKNKPSLRELARLVDLQVSALEWVDKGAKELEGQLIEASDCLAQAKQGGRSVGY